METRMAKAKMDTNIFNMLITRRIFLGTQVEDFDSESSHCISLPIRQIIYSILSKFEGSFEDFVVEEYNRSGRILEMFRRRPSALPVDIDLKNLVKIPVKNRKEIFKKFVGIEFNEDLIDENLKGIFYCIIYWLKNSTPKVPKCRLQALLFTIIRFYYITCDKEKYRILRNMFLKYERKDSMEYIFDKKITHCFMQFQSVYLTFTWLNDLLNRPITFIEPSRILSGWLVYNLSKRFETEDESFIREPVHKESDLKRILNNFVSVLQPYQRE